MGKLSMLGSGSVTETKEYIKAKCGRMGSSCEWKGEAEHIVDGAGTCMLILEKYFWRTDSYTSLSIAITGDEKAVYVDGITAGGGGGLLNFSWGSEDDFLDSFRSLMREKGFEEIF